MKRIQLIYVLFAFPLLLMIVGCAQEDPDTHDHPKDFTGADYYNFHCSECHKESGMGKVLEGIPPVINSDMTHSQMRKFIMTGNYPKGSKHTEKHMPIFAKMPKKEARKITQHVDELFKERLKKR